MRSRRSDAGYCTVLGKCQKAEGSETVGGENTCRNGKSPGKCERERDEKEREIRKLSGDIGAKESRVRSYDEVEDSFNREFSTGLRRNLLGLYEDGALEIFRKEIDGDCRRRKISR